MKTLFLAPTRNGVGLSSTALGLARALERQSLKVAFLKPIAQTYEPRTDDSVHFARAVAHLTTPDPIPLTRAEELLSQGGEEDLMEQVIALAREAAGEGSDVLIAEGLALNERNVYAGTLNARLARNLEADTVLVSSLAGVTPAELADELEIAAQGYRRSDGSGLAGFVLNFAPRELDFGSLMAELRSRSRVLASGELPLLGVVSLDPALRQLRTLDVARALDAEIINAGEAESRRVSSTVVTARSVPQMTNLFTSGALIVTPADREDVIMAAALSHLSGTPLAGLMYTSGSAPEATIQQLCEVALTSSLPVLRVPTNSFETASRLVHLDFRVPHDDPRRMDRMLDYIADRLDTVPLGARLRAPGVAGERRLPPSAFRYELIQRARAANKRIVLPEGDEPRTVKAAIRCTEKGIARCVLLAPPEKVRQVAQGQGLELPEGLEIIDPETVRGKYVAPMVELRKSKGLTEPQAEAQLEDSVVLGTMMLALGEVVGAAVLVVEVVGVFPHVHTQNRGAADARDGFAHQRVVLVGGGHDIELAVLDDQPRPARAEAGLGGVFELLLEGVEAAEGAVDGVQQFAAGLVGAVLALTLAHDLPEHAVVGVAARIVAQGALLVGGHAVELLNELFDGQVGEFGAFERLVGVVHVGLVMLGVVNFHRAGVDMGLKRVVSVGQLGKSVSHDECSLWRQERSERIAV